MLGGNHVTDHLYRDPVINTTIKLRVLARQQQLIRVDFGNTPTHEVLTPVLGRYSTLVPRHDVVVLSDYGKGGFTHIGEMIEISRQVGHRVSVDPKGDDCSCYKGMTMITPNRAEMRQAVGPWKLEQDLTIHVQNPHREL